MDLSIIIVSWNVRDKLKNNLSALFSSQTAFKFEIFVVDNNSADNTAEMVRQEFPQANLIVNQENFGFARACNQGAAKARGRYFLFLNPDMVVFPDTLEKTISILDEKKEITIAGVKLIDEKGAIFPQIRRFPDFGDQLAIILKLPHFFPRILDKYLCAGFDYEKDAAVDSIRGAFFALRAADLGKLLPAERLSEKKIFDERYFIWFEEVDLCREAHEKNLGVWYLPQPRAINFVGESFKQVKRATTQKYFRNSQLAYFKKWQPAWQYSVLKIAWLLIGGLIFIFDKVKAKKDSGFRPSPE